MILKPLLNEVLTNAHECASAIEYDETSIKAIFRYSCLQKSEFDTVQQRTAVVIEVITNPIIKQVVHEPSNCDVVDFENYTSALALAMEYIQVLKSMGISSEMRAAAKRR